MRSNVFVNDKKSFTKKWYWAKQLQLHTPETKDNHMFSFVFSDGRQKKYKNFNKYLKQKSKLLSSTEITVRISPTGFAPFLNRSSVLCVNFLYWCTVPWRDERCGVELILLKIVAFNLGIGKHLVIFYFKMAPEQQYFTEKAHHST